MCRLKRVGLAVVVFTLIISFSVASAAPSEKVIFQTRALSGTDGIFGPGLGPGVNFRNFSGDGGSISPAINAAGNVAFKGFLAGEGVVGSNSSGIWSDRYGSLDLVIRAGESAPGTVPGVKFAGFSDPNINAAGDTAFVAGLSGSGVNELNGGGVWTEGGGTLSFVARSGDTIPLESSSDRFEGFSNPLFNNAGRVAFFTHTFGLEVGTNIRGGIWSNVSAVLEPVAREDSIANGTHHSVRVSNLFGSSPTLNDWGTSAFMASAKIDGVDSTFHRGIWTETSGVVTSIVRSGYDAPGTSVKFDNFGTPVLNNSGQIAFGATLAGAGVSSSNRSGIWSGSAESLQLIVRAGEAAPGAPLAGAFNDFGNPVLNGVGQIAFEAGLQGLNVNSQNDRGIWRHHSDRLELVGREGDHAPGSEPGVRFGTEFTSPFSGPVLNGQGQTAFLAHLVGDGVNDSNNQGIWATDPGGTLHLVVREGELFDVNSDPYVEELRTISFMNIRMHSGGQDGRRTSFSDSGQLAFWLLFTDGSEGIFTATIVPEPGSLLQAFLLVSVITFWWRRKLLSV